MERDGKAAAALQAGREGSGSAQPQKSSPSSGLEHVEVGAFAEPHHLLLARGKEFN